MSEETAVVEAPQPTLAESYIERTSDASGEAESKAESKRRSREAAEPEERGAHLAKTEPKQSISDAFDGAAPEEAETFLLPDQFTGFEKDEIDAVLGLIGLEHSDLLDEETAALVLSELEDAFGAREGEAADEDEAEEPEEKEKTEEKKVEPRPSKLAELTEPQRVEMQQHVEQVWNRSQQVNDPVYSEHFTAALAGALGTPAEGMPALQSTVEILQFGAQNLIESALPALNHRYMAQHLMPILEQMLPGITETHNLRTATATWDQVRDENEQFASLPDFESKEFIELRDKIRAASPWIDNWDPDPKMSPLQALKSKAELFARLAMGERVDPKKIQQQISDALVTGKRAAEKSNRRVSASRAIKGGRSTGTIGEAKERSSLMDAFERGGGMGGIS